MAEVEVEQLKTKVAELEEQQKQAYEQAYENYAKRLVPQLLKAFYDRRQREGETLRFHMH